MRSSASITSRVNAPYTVEQPSSMVADAILMASTSPTPLPGGHAEFAAVLRVRKLEVAQARRCRQNQQARLVDRPESARPPASSQAPSAIIASRILIGDPDPGGALRRRPPPSGRAFGMPVTLNAP